MVAFEAKDNSYQRFDGQPADRLQSCFASNLKQHAYWLDLLPPPPSLPEKPLKTVDVVIVGSGYTGLNAALETIRGGRSTLVLDAENPGFGCSTRNGGQISTSIKPSLSDLTAKYGPSKACAIRQEGENALQWIETLINREKIKCDFNRSGRYHAAHTPQHYDCLLYTSDAADE